MARILVIDDSVTERTAITSWLTKAGHVAIEAAEAETGMALALQQRPDLILMDVILPGQNGFEATRQLRKTPATSNIPVVIISSKSQASDLAWGKRQGAIDYLPKPFGQQSLIKTIAEALNRSKD